MTGSTPLRDGCDAPTTTHAFEAFLAHAHPRLERALVARYGVDVGAEAVAAAVAYAWGNWRRVAGLGNPIGYLYRVGQSEARRHHRWNTEPALPQEIPQPDGTATRLHDALARLNHRQRTAVVLIYSFHYSYAEVAEVTGLPLSSIKNHAARGLKKLRKMLEEDHG